MLINLKEELAGSGIFTAKFDGGCIFGSLCSSNNGKFKIVFDKSLYSNNDFNLLLLNDNYIIKKLKLNRPYSCKSFDSGNFLVLNLFNKGTALKNHPSELYLYDVKGDIISKEKSNYYIDCYNYHEDYSLITYYSNRNLVIVGIGETKSKISITLPFTPSDCYIVNNILKVKCPDYMYYSDYNIDLIKMYKYFEKQVPFNI